MSLLDPKHLLAPFKNKTHLFTLIGIILVFGLFRYLGGGITTETPSGLAKVSKLINQETTEEDAIVDEDAENVDSEITIDSESYPDEETTKVAKPNQKKAIEYPSKKDSESNQDTSELDEIEKAMGLK